MGFINKNIQISNLRNTYLNNIIFTQIDRSLIKKLVLTNKSYYNEMKEVIRKLKHNYYSGLSFYVIGPGIFENDTRILRRTNDKGWDLVYQSDILEGNIVLSIKILSMYDHDNSGLAFGITNDNLSHCDIMGLHKHNKHFMGFNASGQGQNYNATINDFKECKPFDIVKIQFQQNSRKVVFYKNDLQIGVGDLNKLVPYSNLRFKIYNVRKQHVLKIVEFNQF